MHCLTAWGQWAVELLQCTATGGRPGPVLVCDTPQPPPPPPPPPPPGLKDSGAGSATSKCP